MTLYANRQANEEAIEDQNFAWEEWNRVMRVRLEKYYRFSFVFCVAFFVQVVMIFIVMFNAFKNLFRINMSWYTVFEFINLLFAWRHLN